MIQLNDTIVAIATPPGVGAIGVIRLSGEDAITIANTIFAGEDLSKAKSHTLHYGSIKEDKTVLDDVLVSVFRNPKSYTGENSIEISCHGSPYILQQVLELCIRKGARLAQPGEFTQRAFLNGKLDLASAEAVQDVIMSNNKASHELALSQLRGGFSQDIEKLRQQLIHFASMIELELDFGEEDVEFANRDELVQLVQTTLNYIYQLTESFQLGNAIKNGVSTVIAGRPNAGKSTLLNALLNEERAIVSDIAGTTRDSIEESLNIQGVQFRLIDTAGIREAHDAIEKIGVERALEHVNKSAVLVYVFDANELSVKEVQSELERISENSFLEQEQKDQVTKLQQTLVVANKVDLVNDFDANDFTTIGLPKDRIIGVSAINKANIQQVKEALYHLAISTELSKNNTIVSNARHYEALSKASTSLEAVLNGIHNNVSSDFVAMDIRHALTYLGEITGTITTDDLLDRIFREFCIGK